MLRLGSVAKGKGSSVGKSKGVKGKAFEGKGIQGSSHTGGGKAGKTVDVQAGLTLQVSWR